MRYRVIKSGNGFYAQCRPSWWPFWTRVFDFGFNHFATIEAAQTAITKVISYSLSDGAVVKEWSAEELLISTTRRGIEMSDQSTEQEIKDKGLTGPRVTPDHIEETIHTEHYFTASDAVQTTNAVNHLGDNAIPSYALDLLTICVLVMKNGFTVTGESACASPRNFDAGLGRKIARQNAIAKIWPLEGYLLKQRLADADQA
jgi:hypothetical protein